MLQVSDDKEKCIGGSTMRRDRVTFILGSVAAALLPELDKLSLFNAQLST